MSRNAKTLRHLFERGSFQMQQYPKYELYVAWFHLLEESFPGVKIIVPMESLMMKLYAESGFSKNVTQSLCCIVRNILGLLAWYCSKYLIASSAIPPVSTLYVDIAIRFEEAISYLSNLNVEAW